MVALNATTLALEISSIPWSGHVGGVRVAHTHSGETIMSPTYKQTETDNVLDAVVCVRNDRVCMLEVEASEVSEPILESAITVSLGEIQSLHAFMETIIQTHAQDKLPFFAPEDRLDVVFDAHIAPLVQNNLSGVQEKHTRSEWMNIFTSAAQELFDDVKPTELYTALDAGIKHVVRSEV